MTNDEGRDAEAFGLNHQLTGAFTHLADATGGGIEVAGKDGLDRVDDQKGRLEFDNALFDLFQRGFSQQI